MKVALIGPMGAGKTTVGALVADRLGVGFFDSDRWVEHVRGVDGGEIARTEGVDVLHDLEAEALATALDWPEDTVIAPAASVVDRSELRARLAAETIVFHLDLPLDVERQRIDGPDHRRAMDPAEMAAIRERRRPLCIALAFRTLDATLPPEDLASEIVSLVRGA